MSKPKPIKPVGRIRDQKEYIRNNSSALRTGFLMFLSENERMLEDMEINELNEIMKYHMRNHHGYNAIMMLEIKEEGE